MTVRWTCAAVGVALASAVLASCARSNVNQFLSQATGQSRVIALINVRTIDGTGGPGKDNQTIVIDGERIAAIGNAADVKVPPGARTLDLQGRTAFPGLVGMHDHLFYHVGGGDRVAEVAESFAQLYLASGVTTIRTAGAVDFDSDLRMKRLIDDGTRPGPTIYVTGPYLHALTAQPDPERVARDVASWADRGATSFKAYMSLRRDELKAAIDTAHARGLKVTGHLCAVGFREAAAMGIDGIEHGLLEDSEFTATKQPDYCPDGSQTLGAVMALDIAGPQVQSTIAALVRKGVAITSTLAVYESFAARAQLDVRAQHVLAPWALEIYHSAQARLTSDTARAWDGLVRKEMDFERAFVAAGGRLVAGVDPTGWGGVVAGFGDQREVELLVDAGFTPEMAIRIATANGAAQLNDASIGLLAAGMQADVVVVRGNPSANISELRNIEVVFRKGVGYDPDALIQATYGTVGKTDVAQVFRSWKGWLIITLAVLLIARRVWRHTRPADG